MKRGKNIMVRERRNNREIEGKKRGKKMQKDEEENITRKKKCKV